MSPFLSSTGPTASLSSNLASNKTSSVNQLINRSSNCCGRSLIRPVLSAVWVAASPQCLPLVYITIHFVRSCLLYKGGYRWVRRPSNGRMGTSALTPGYDRFRRGRCPQRPVDNGCTPVVPLIRHGLRSRWQLCCLTNAAYPLRVLTPMPPSPLRGEGYDRFVGSAQMSMAFPSSVTAAPCHLPPGEGGGAVSKACSWLPLWGSWHGEAVTERAGG